MFSDKFERRKSAVFAIFSGSIFFLVNEYFLNELIHEVTLKEGEKK